jgi:beta-lactamase superfamily II metal-dependent hydrolase
MKKRLIGGCLYCLMAMITHAQTSNPITSQIAWKEGYMDIHHILTGSGNASFIMMPDGTSMLIDAGDIGDRKLKKTNSQLKSTDPYPNVSKTAAQWIVDYIKQVLPDNPSPNIDYALLTHYHDDHIGGITAATKTSKTGNYKITGITEIGDLIKIKKIIDRNYPSNDFPINLTSAYDNENSIFINLQRFIEFQKKHNGLVAEQLQVGKTDQIVLNKTKNSFPEFQVRGIKRNGTIYSGIKDSTLEYFSSKDILNVNGKFDENPLSLAIKISYGKFDYFTGGDNTGLQGFGMPYWFDVETPMAKSVGNVEVTTLCHHGCRDAVNDNFLNILKPKVIVQEAWSSNHPGEEVLQRMLYRKIENIFATQIQQPTKDVLGFWLSNNYKSTLGHVIIRVLPGGNSFFVLIAETEDEKVTIKKSFGPFKSE